MIFDNYIVFFFLSLNKILHHFDFLILKQSQWWNFLFQALYKHLKHIWKTFSQHVCTANGTVVMHMQYKHLTEFLACIKVVSWFQTILSHLFFYPHLRTIYTFTSFRHAYKSYLVEYIWLRHELDVKYMRDICLK